MWFQLLVHLDTFIFDTASDDTMMDEHLKPSADNIQRMSIEP